MLADGADAWGDPPKDASPDHLLSEATATARDCVQAKSVSVLPYVL